MNEDPEQTELPLFEVPPLVLVWCIECSEQLNIYEAEAHICDACAEIKRQEWW